LREGAWTVDDLQRMRGFVDEAERMLVGRIAYLDALPDQ